MEKRQHQLAASDSRRNTILGCMVTGPRGKLGQGLLEDEQVEKRL